MRKLLVIHFLEKTRYNTKAILKSYELFMETYITLLIYFVKGAKILTPWHRV